MSTSTSIMTSLLLTFQASRCFAVGIDQKSVLPPEYEALGGHASALSQSGVEGLADVATVKGNPAVMTFERTYLLSGAYYWPEQGRDFYQVGVVDSTNSHLAAGFNYSGFVDESLTTVEQPIALEKRATVALAKSLGHFALGINGDLVEGKIRKPDGEVIRKRRTTAGLGLAALLTKRLRVGLSAANLNNSRVSYLAPMFIRAGIAWLPVDDNLALQLSYRRRQRLWNEANPSLDSGEQVSEDVAIDTASFEDDSNRFEDMVVVSMVAKVYSLLRVMASYGHEVGGVSRQVAGLGFGVFQGDYSLSYSAYKPSLDLASIQYSATLNLAFNF